MTLSSRIQKGWEKIESCYFIFTIYLIKRQRTKWAVQKVASAIQLLFGEEEKEFEVERDIDPSVPPLDQLLLIGERILARKNSRNFIGRREQKKWKYANKRM
mmetsp:Transcript_24831/g.34688  ORF Transcript_24831/g.34688 Transcript_24831/m.34688 type:complete len:102 (-) Transcript_24831:1757-2062(-)